MNDRARDLERYKNELNMILNVQKSTIFYNLPSVIYKNNNNNNNNTNNNKSE